MSNSISLNGIYFTENPKQKSFKDFAEDKGFFVSVFENLLSSGNKNNKKDLMKRDEILAQLQALKWNYQLYLERLFRQHTKEIAVEKGIQKVRSDLWDAVMNERKKLDLKIYDIKRKYGKENTKRKIKKAETKTDEIYSSGKIKAWDIASHAREMTSYSSIPEILNYSTYSVNKLVDNGRYEFNSVLKELENERIG